MYDRPVDADIEVLMLLHGARKAEVVLGSDD
jgi:hypothetical protein